jgi:pimeloyl-ACP methyl ester carboxylesterase
MASPRPVGRESWLDRALRDYRVLLLDQRGTGRSPPVTWRVLEARGDATAQAGYLAHFRADSIVADAELIRRELIGDRPWTVLGQSRLSFSAGPLYAILHEACYAQGAATRWSAQRVRAEFPEFAALAALETGAPVLFTGEMVYPWLFQTDPVLRPVADAAELIAQWEPGRGCTTRRCWPTTGCPRPRRSTWTTCTCPRRSRSPRPVRSAACGRG